jgi:hypothetical protein
MGGCHPDLGAEDARQMTLIGEPGASGDGAQRETAVGEQRPRAIDLAPAIVSMNRDAVCRSKDARDDTRVPSHRTRRVGQGRATHLE